MLRRGISTKVKSTTLRASARLSGLAFGAGAAYTSTSVSAPWSARDGSRRMQSGFGPPAQSFCFSPMIDYPLDRKVLITENVPIDGRDGLYEQHDSIHGTGGAVSLAFDAKKWSADGPVDEPQPTWVQSQVTGDGSYSPDRPLRVAVSSTGIRKQLVRDVSVNGAPYVFWKRFELPNFAVKGEDVGFLTGEDAITFGHCGVDESDTRYEYVPINKQSDELMDQLFKSIQLGDHIERARYQSQGKKFPKDVQLQGLALANNLSEPFGDRASLSTLLINDTNTERIEYRNAYLKQHPGLASNHLSDDQLRQIRSQLQDPAYSKLFLNTLLPLPVVAPMQSHTKKNEDQYGDDSMDFAALTTTEAFGKMGKDQPLMSAAVIGVSDGVGGMMSYGDKNNTKEMSHLLMRSVRHNLTHDKKVSARDLLGQAWTSVLRHNQINIGACTASIGVLRPTEPEEPEDEFDDGRRLHLSAANLGDSTIFAFRPKHNHDFGTVTYVPLAMAWPNHHSAHNLSLLPPLQLTIYGHPGRPDLVADPDSNSDMSTTLSTSHFSTPTRENSGPSGGSNFFTSKVDYLKVLSGKKKLSDLFDHLSPNQTQINSIDRFSEIQADSPWMSQSFEGVTLRRGDVICAMSDGITDNLLDNQLTTPAELWEAVVAYAHPAIRAQHPATRNVRPFRQVHGKPLDHLSGSILHKLNKTPTTDALEMTNEILSKISDTQIPEFDPEGASKPYVSLRSAPPYEATMILNTTQTPPILDEEHRPPPAELSPEQNEQLYKYNYVSTEGVRYHSTLTGDTEAVVAGTLSSAMAGSLVRLSQRGAKIDDMSVVVAVVY